MGEQRAEHERRLKHLVSTMRCHVCRRRFERAQVRVAAREDQLWIVSVRCGHCRNQQVFCATLKPPTGDGLRDVSDDEERQFEAMGPVRPDDVLDVHQFLQDFDGDFKRLFAESAPPS